MISRVSHIQTEIENNQGQIPFDRFMELALYGFPDGYYRRTEPVIGQAGDFITAPEISPLYSHCLARCFQSLQQTLPDAVIFELGAGNGTLAVDCLLYLRDAGTLPSRYYILELSAHLAATQRHAIEQADPALLAIVEWISAIPDNLNAMVIANEVLDAMPVKQFRVIEGQLEECYVRHQDNGFYYAFTKPSDELTEYAKNLPAEVFTFENYHSECNLHIEPWLNALFAALNKGVIYLIDYGFPAHEYYHPARHMGTLMCHAKHQTHSNPLLAVGEQDLTAHVDFTAVATHAFDAGFEIAGYTNQAHFLINCGILSTLADNVLSLDVSSAIKKLTLPHEMGELFKVIALAKGDIIPLGFSQGDQRHKL